MRRIHHRTSISPDRVPWRRRIAEAGTGAVPAAGMVAAASGPAAAGGPPVLAFTPSRHDYGQVTAGQTAAQTFTLASTGGQAIRALTVTLSESAAFTITADTCTATSLRPSTSCTITVRFAPASTGHGRRHADRGQQQKGPQAPRSPRSHAAMKPSAAQRTIPCHLSGK